MTGREGLAEALTTMHFDGHGCGVDPESPNACSHCFGPSPMSAHEVADAVLAHIAAILHDDATVAEVQSDHWLIMTSDGEIVGCQCGYKASPDDCGYGDGVIEHILHEHLTVLAERLGVPHD